jgi:hypothetical protein
MKNIIAASVILCLISFMRPSWGLAAHEYKSLTDSVSSDEMIVFESSAKLRHITVFTDIDCGQCRKLHTQIPVLNASGVDVRYLAFPLGGIGSSGFKKFVSVYCADDPKKALTVAKMGMRQEPADCSNPVENNYALGKRLGVKGTPTIVFDDGTVISGYMSARKLLRRMKVAYVRPAKGQEMIPEVAASRIEAASYLVINKTQIYNRPDTRMESRGTMEPGVVHKFSLEADVDGQRWLGFKKSGSQYYTPAANLQLIPKVATTKIESKKYVANKATSLYISPDRSSRKMADMPARSYIRFKFEVTKNNERWLGFSKGGINYYVPAKDLDEENVP